MRTKGGGIAQSRGGRETRKVARSDEEETAGKFYSLRLFERANVVVRETKPRNARLSGAIEIDRFLLINCAGVRQNFTRCGVSFRKL